MHETTTNSFEQFKSLIESLYELHPLAVITLILLGFSLIYVGYLFAPLKKGIVTIVVFIVSVTIYFNAGYTESVIALVTGLLPVLFGQWGISEFILFLFSWIGLCGILIIATSIRLASKCEDLYTQAASFNKHKDTEKFSTELQNIGADYHGILGPVEKAEVIKHLVFRGFPTEAMPNALEKVDQLSAVTKVDYLKISVFVADLFKTLPEKSEEREVNHWIDKIFEKMQETSANPQTFIDAFMSSRHFVLSEKIEFSEFLEKLSSALESGYTEQNIEEFFELNSVSQELGA